MCSELNPTEQVWNDLKAQRQQSAAGYAGTLPEFTDQCPPDPALAGETAIIHLGIQASVATLILWRLLMQNSIIGREFTDELCFGPSQTANPAQFERGKASGGQR